MEILKFIQNWEFNTFSEEYAVFYEKKEDTFEYRTYQYYTYTPEIAIDLVEKGYAIWDDRAVELRGKKLRYNINMKAVY